MSKTQTIIVVGATGEIGKALCAALLRNPHYSLVVFSRNPERARTLIPGARDYIAWQPEEQGDWTPAIDGAHALINLAGAPTFGVRWTPEYRKELQENRLTITRGLVNAIMQAKSKPSVFINGSSVGSYGFTSSGNNTIDEDTRPDQDLFAEESLAVEHEAERATTVGVRTVLLRTSFVLDRHGGGLPQMAQSVRRFTGGILLPGTQWLPWIHIDDEVGIILKALSDERVQGPLNATAPEVLTNRGFMQTMGKVLHRPVIMRVPGFILRRFMGDSSAILLKGRRIMPQKALKLGYRFEYPTLYEAMTNLLQDH